MHPPPLKGLGGSQEEEKMEGMVPCRQLLLPLKGEPPALIPHLPPHPQAWPTCSELVSLLPLCTPRLASSPPGWLPEPQSDSVTPCLKPALAP